MCREVGAQWRAETPTQTTKSAIRFQRTAGSTEDPSGDRNLSLFPNTARSGELGAVLTGQFSFAARANDGARQAGSCTQRSRSIMPLILG